MTRITWDKTGERLYETGNKQAVLYVRDASGQYPLGVPWNGLISAKQAPEGAEPTDLYADNIAYLSLTSVEKFKATISAYSYPEEFNKCDGSEVLVPGLNVGQQPRATFGFCYRTEVGNDVDYEQFGYKLHIIWGAKCAPSARDYETINDTPGAITFSWNITTIPYVFEKYPKLKPTAYICLDSTKLGDDVMSAVEDILYGDDKNPAHLPTPDELLDLIKK